MGREIRRVPRNWEHLRDGNGHYIPLLDEDYESACAKWKREYQQWYDGTHEVLLNYPDYRKCYEFWEWRMPPTHDLCRPKFETEATCYQIYENVSEGTPVSPVFETVDDLVTWLVEQGYSKVAAQGFVEIGMHS